MTPGIYTAACVVSVLENQVTRFVYANNGWRLTYAPRLAGKIHKPRWSGRNACRKAQCLSRCGVVISNKICCRARCKSQPFDGAYGLRSKDRHDQANLVCDANAENVALPVLKMTTT